MTDTPSRLSKVIIQSLDCDLDQITPDATLRDLCHDDLSFIQVIMDIEDEFDVEFPDEDTEAVKTVGDLLRLVEGKIGREGRRDRRSATLPARLAAP